MRVVEFAAVGVGRPLSGMGAESERTGTPSLVCTLDLPLANWVRIGCPSRLAALCVCDPFHS